MAQRSYRRQSSGGAGAAGPRGHIVHLQAPPEPIAVSRRARSINVPRETVPGLAIHVPPALRRPPSTTSLQQESLDQLRRLKLALAGDRQPRRGISGEGKQILMSEKETITNVDNIKGQDASAGGYSTPRIPSGAVPVQSPYSLYGTSSGILTSSVSCLSKDLMAGQVDDGFTPKPAPAKEASIENNKQTIEVLPPPTEPVKLKKRSSSLSRSRSRPKKPENMQQAIMSVVKDAQAKSAPLAVQPFDIQRSLEKQLAVLPNSRLPGTSTQSFDEHSYILASGTASVGSKNSKHSSIERHVSVLPCESFTPSYMRGVAGDASVMEKTLSKTSMKRNRPTRLPPLEHADTIRLDKGLICVDPNNLKPQMQEILQQRKSKGEKGPLQQVGKIVEVSDLVERSKNKGMRVKLGSTLKDLFPDRLRDSRARSLPIPRPLSRSRAQSRGRPPRNSKPSQTQTDHNSKYQNQQAQNKSAPEVSTEKDDERLWVKQTIEQENYKITKVLGSGGQTSENNPATAPPKIEEVTSGILSEVVEAESVGSAKAGNNMEIVMAAEGKSPMYKVPDRLDTTPKQLIVDDSKKTSDVQKKHATNRLAKLARRLSVKQRDVIKERLGEKGKESITRSQTHGAKTKTAKEHSLDDRARLPGGSGKPKGPHLDVETRPLSPTTVEELGGSFCLTPAALENSFSLDQSFTDLANNFFQQQEASKTKDSPLIRDSSVRSKAEIIRQGRLALMVTLKHRIINELKMQKMREVEAAKKGELISEEEKARQLEVVRRLHLRREALQHLGDDDIRDAFNDRLQTYKQNAEQIGKGTGDKPDGNSENGRDGKEDGGDNNKQGESSNDATPTNRKSVSFARQTVHDIISKKAASNRDDDDDDDEDGDGDEDTLLDHDSLYYDDFSGSGGQFARRGIMSWANCGVHAADACVPSSEEIRKLRERGLSTIEKNFEKRPKKDGETTTVTSRTSTSSRSRRTQKPTPPPGLMPCAPMQAGSNDDDDSSYDSESSGSQSSGSSASKSRRDRRRKSPKKSKSRERRRQSDRSVASGRSRASYETRDSRRSQFTEDTRRSRDSRASYETRDTRNSRRSFASYDTRDSYEDRGRRSRRSSGSRKYASNSVAATEIFSEYTEDSQSFDRSFEDDFLRCGAD